MYYNLNFFTLSHLKLIFIINKCYIDKIVLFIEISTCMIYNTILSAIAFEILRSFIYVDTIRFVFRIPDIFYVNMTRHCYKCTCSLAVLCSFVV